MTWITLDSPDALEALLQTHGIDTAQWGMPHSKRVIDLWEEIVAGETRIGLDPLRRELLGVVEIIIRQGGFILIETRQEFQSGLVRDRAIPPSEKMKAGESYLDAARRGLGEELGLQDEAIDIREERHQTRQETHMSLSYPGLKSLYTFHTVEARVEGLPSDAFTTDEYGEDGEVVVTHYWAWQLESARSSSG